MPRKADLSGTFAAVPRWLAEEATPHEVAVYVALAMRVQGIDGRCFPSLETIAADAHMGVKTVQKALQGLRRRGAVTWVRPNAVRRSNCYWVRFNQDDAFEGTEWDEANYAPEEDFADA